MNTDFENARKQLDELIGSKVELVITSGLYKGSYPSRLEELDSNFIGVAHPTVRGALLPALRSMELVMKIDSANCYHQGTVIATRSVVNSALPILWLKLASPLEKVQRRMFVRVKTSIKADVFFLGTDEEVLPENVILPPREWFPVRIVDMSLGGAGISVKEKLKGHCLEGGRYLLSMNIGGTSFFIVGKLIKIFKRNEATIEIGLAYESLGAFVEKLMGGYIRQQELVSR